MGLPLKHASPMSALKKALQAPSLFLHFSKVFGQYFKAKTLNITLFVEKHVANCNDCQDESEESAFQTK